MNYYDPAPKFVDTEMSADGLVTIPDAIRRATGLVPGRRLVVGVNDRGEAIILTRTQAKRRGETAAQRAERIDKALDAIGTRFSTGQSTAEVMEELRGSREG